VMVFEVLENSGDYLRRVSEGMDGGGKREWLRWSVKFCKMSDRLCFRTCIRTHSVHIVSLKSRVDFNDETRPLLLFFLQSQTKSPAIQ